MRALCFKVNVAREMLSWLVSCKVGLTLSTDNIQCGGIILLTHGALTYHNLWLASTFKCSFVKPITIRLCKNVASFKIQHARKVYKISQETNFLTSFLIGSKNVWISSLTNQQLVLMVLIIYILSHELDHHGMTWTCAINTHRNIPYWNCYTLCCLSNQSWCKLITLRLDILIYKYKVLWP